MEDLKSYEQQVEDFMTFGDVSELNKYLKKALALNSKVDLVMEKVLCTLDKSIMVYFTASLARFSST